MADKKKKSSDDDLVKEGRDQFELAQSAESENRKIALEDMKFSLLGEQWPENIRKKREAEDRPCLTINKMPSFTHQVINDLRQNKPSIKVHPADSGADPKTAEVLNGLIRNIEYMSHADVAYDTGAECAVNGGRGCWRVGLDYAYDDAFDMDLRIERIANPFALYGDPHSQGAGSLDWNVAHYVDRLSKKQFEAEYNDKQKVDWDDDAWTGLQGTEWVGVEDVMVAEWWTREKVDKQIYLFQDMRSGQMVTLDDKGVADEDIQTLLQAGVLQFKQERTTKGCEVTQRIMSGVEVLKETKWKGRYIPFVVVYGKEFNIEGKRHLRSLINPAKDSQLLYNIWRTTGAELVALTPRIPFIGPKGAFASDPNWQISNKASVPYLEYDTDAVLRAGGQPPMRQPIDTGAAAGVLQEALNANDDMKATIGLFDASLGAQSNETSGKAITARQREGDVATFHFSDNVVRAIRDTGCILLDLIPHVYNKERIIRVMGEDGEHQSVKVNTQQPVEQQDKKGNPILALHDLTAGKYDLTVKAGPSFTTRREEAAYEMTEAVRAYPQGAPVLVPLIAKNSDWPGAEDVAEKLEAMASGQIPPELQQKIEEGQKRIQQLEEENQALKLDQAAEQQKIAAQAQVDQAKLASQQQLDMAKLQSAEHLKMMEIASDEKIALIKIEADERVNEKKATMAAVNQAAANRAKAQQNADAR